MRWLVASDPLQSPCPLPAEKELRWWTPSLSFWKKRLWIKKRGTRELYCTLEVELWETQGFAKLFRTSNIKFTKITLFRRGNSFILPCLCSPWPFRRAWGLQGGCVECCALIVLKPVSVCRDWLFFLNSGLWLSLCFCEVFLFCIMLCASLSWLQQRCQNIHIVGLRIKLGMEKEWGEGIDIRDKGEDEEGEERKVCPGSPVWLRRDSDPVQSPACSCQADGYNLHAGCLGCLPYSFRPHSPLSHAFIHLLSWAFAIFLLIWFFLISFAIFDLLFLLRVLLRHFITSVQPHFWSGTYIRNVGDDCLRQRIAGGQPPCLVLDLKA